MTPALSVVIPSHRRVDLLVACLTALADHAPPDTQVIVVDDGSPGHAVTRCAGRFAGVEVIRHDRPRGFCAAANAGIARAAAPIVQMLNDDAEVTAGWAAPALAAFADPDIVAVAPLVLRHADGRIDSAGDDYDPAGFARPRGRGAWPIGRWLESCDVTAASACAAFYRRAALESVGGFAESFIAYFDDVDLALRLRRAGGRIVYVPQSQVRHHGSATHGRPHGRLVRQQSCNEERLYWRHAPPGVRHLLRHGAVLAGKALRRAGEGTLTPWLIGRAEAWYREASCRPSSHR